MCLQDPHALLWMLPHRLDQGLISAYARHPNVSAANTLDEYLPVTMLHVPMNAGAYESSNVTCALSSLLRFVFEDCHRKLSAGCRLLMHLGCLGLHELQAIDISPAQVFPTSCTGGICFAPHLLGMMKRPDGLETRTSCI